MLKLIRGNTRVDWEDIGEGWNGDYDPDDPDDTPLLRFSVYRRDPESYTGWTECNDASYCTQMPADTDPAILRESLEYIMESVCEDVENGNSIKGACERLSWIGPGHFPC